METLPVSPPAGDNVGPEPLPQGTELLPPGLQAPPTARNVTPAPTPAISAGTDALALAFQTSAEIEQIVGALAKAQLEFTAAEKNAKADVQPKDTSRRGYSYRYADLAEIIGATQPALNAQGVTIMQFPIVGERSAGCVTFLAHTSGQWFRNVLRLGLSSNALPQDAGGVITYARRYAWQAICGIAPEDDHDAQPQAARNGNGRAVEVILPQRASTAQASAPATYTAPAAALSLVAVKPRKNSKQQDYLELEDSRGRSWVTFDPARMDEARKIFGGKLALKDIRGKELGGFLHVEAFLQ